MSEIRDNATVLIEQTSTAVRRHMLKAANVGMPVIYQILDDDGKLKFQEENSLNTFSVPLARLRRSNLYLVR